MAGLGRHRRETFSGMQLTRRGKAIAKRRRTRRQETVPGGERSLISRQDLPPEAGGAGHHRRGDCFNPVLPSFHLADGASYWEQGERLMREGQEATRRMDEAVLGETENANVFGRDSSGPCEQDEEDVDSDIAPNADHAPSFVLFEAKLNLSLDMGKKTWAFSIDRLLRMITQEGFKETVDMLKDNEMDSFTRGKEHLEDDAEDFMTDLGFNQVWIENQGNAVEGGLCASTGSSGRRKASDGTC